MKMILRRIICLVMLVAPATLPPRAVFGVYSSEPDGSGIVYDMHFAFRIKPPSGWKPGDGKKEGWQVAFLPGEERRDARGAVLYVRTAPKTCGSDESLQSFIDAHEKRLRAAAGRNLGIENTEPIITADGKTARVRRYSGATPAAREIAAYLEEETVFVLIALKAGTKDVRNASLGAFESLVKSYSFLTTNIKIR